MTSSAAASGMRLRIRDSSSARPNRDIGRLQHGLDVHEDAARSESSGQIGDRHRHVGGVGDSQDERIQIVQLLERDQVHAVLVAGLLRRRERVVDERLDPELTKLTG